MNADALTVLTLEGDQIGLQELDFPVPARPEDGDGDLLSMQCKKAIGKFPVAEFSLRVTDRLSWLSGLRKGDRVRIDSRPNAKTSHKVFVGEAVRIESSGSKNADGRIVIVAASQFMRLEMLRVGTEQLGNTDSLRSLINTLVKLAGINVAVSVGDDVEDTCSLGPIRGFPPIVLLRVLALQKGLVIEVPVGDEMIVTSVAAMAKRYFGPPAAVFGADDILGWKFEHP